MKFLVTLCCVFSVLSVCAGVKISGKVTDLKGQVLPFASIQIKGTTRGTTTNNEGVYMLDLEPGNYIISAQYVGYEKKEASVFLKSTDQVLDFVLSPLQLMMKEVVVRPGAPDPAYEIMRQAIKKRAEYENPLDSFTCEAYIKTLVKTEKLPDKFFGKKIEKSDKVKAGLDSVGKGILFLSESFAKISFKKPNKTKLEVISGRQSGSNGFGFNFPTFINFYNNNVQVFSSRLNPRGFVSPVAEGALFYYKFKFLGSFWEDGREINQIQVTPKRKMEPLFEGTIQITEGDWRIHSVDLLLTKNSQLELIDSLRIRQLSIPVSKNVWRTKDQHVLFGFKQFGFEASGSFLNVYSKYELAPGFARKFFNNVLIKYDTNVNKKSRAYWDASRPVPLEKEEMEDYQLKDSLFAERRDRMNRPEYQDSLRKARGKISFNKIMYRGFQRSNYKTNPTVFSWKALAPLLQYNTVEGLAVNTAFGISHSFHNRSASLRMDGEARYGVENKHLNGAVFFRYRPAQDSVEDNVLSGGRSDWSLGIGKQVVQFNRNNPITPDVNTRYTLLVRENYMKIYERAFVDLGYRHNFDKGLELALNLSYEDRIPLENNTDFSIIKNNRVFTPNYPFEQINANFNRHKAFLSSIRFQYRPGLRYVELPGRKIPIGSKYPTLSLELSKGIPTLFSSKVDFTKWKFVVWDEVNFKLNGSLKYRLAAGGFLTASQLPIQDYHHFNGNKTLFASEYVNSFQMAPYYANSTNSTLFLIAHLEHHFNGLITNKIPLFRRLNWNLVAGVNSFYVNSDNRYLESFAGLENLFKIMRVDFVQSYLNGKQGQSGIRFGFGGLLGSSIQIRR